MSAFTKPRNSLHKKLSTQNLEQLHYTFQPREHVLIGTLIKNLHNLANQSKMCWYFQPLFYIGRNHSLNIQMF